MAHARFSKQSYYELLEVEPNAPQNEIHKAYRRAKETYSVDSPALLTMFSPQEAKELLKLVEEAFRVLSNQSLRQQYDAQLISLPERETLPDFEPDDVPSEKINTSNNSVEEVKSANPSSIENIPEGFAKTKFSVYEEDEAFENEILTREEIDGPFLQKIRLYKQVNLEQVSDETRISKSYLIALESNDYEALPAGVYVRGFVVQVARILKIDDKRIVDAYMKTFKAATGG